MAKKKKAMKATAKKKKSAVKKPRKKEQAPGTFVETPLKPSERLNNLDAEVVGIKQLWANLERRAKVEEAISENILNRLTIADDKARADAENKAQETNALLQLIAQLEGEAKKRDKKIDELGETVYDLKNQLEKRRSEPRVMERKKTFFPDNTIKSVEEVFSVR